MVATCTATSTSDDRPLLPLLMFLFVSLVISGSSPSSASCPASPILSPPTPRTRSPAISYVPSWPPPPLPSSPFRSPLSHLNYLLLFWFQGFLQTCAILETVHAAIGGMNCSTPLSFLPLISYIIDDETGAVLIQDWCPLGRFLLSCNGEGGLTLFSLLSDKSPR